MIVLYVDGSECTFHGKAHTRVVSYGVVAHCNDETFEDHGAFTINANYAGYYEIVAFINGYLFARDKGFSAKDMSFYTDDETVAYACTKLNPDNCLGIEKSKQIKNRFKLACKLFFKEHNNLYEEIIDCLLTSRFIKVKGHKTTVYNLRVDYLAKYAKDLLLNAENDITRTFLVFTDWISAGFIKFTSRGESYTWHPPFNQTIAV